MNKETREAIDSELYNLVGTAVEISRNSFTESELGERLDVVIAKSFKVIEQHLTSQGYHQVEEVQIPELREKARQEIAGKCYKWRYGTGIPWREIKGAVLREATLALADQIIALIQPLIDQAVQAERAKYEEVEAKVLSNKGG